MTFVFILKIFLFIVFFTTSFVRFFFFALKFSKNCAACVARQLHQADYVNSLCVGNVVDVEMLDSSCALQSRSISYQIVKFGSVSEHCISIAIMKPWLYMYNS